MDENAMRGKYSWIKYNEKKIQLGKNTTIGKYSRMKYSGIKIHLSSDP